MTEAEFEKKYHERLLLIEEIIEVAVDEDDADLDYETVNEILTITCYDGSSIIITRQMALKELWLAAKSGGFHFKYQNDIDDWSCNGSALPLKEMLSQIIEQQGKIKLTF